MQYNNYKQLELNETPGSETDETAAQKGKREQHQQAIPILQLQVK